jgi:hypothetical protein
VKEKTWYINTAIHADLIVSVFGREVSLPVSDAAEGAVGVMFVFTNKRKAQKHDKAASVATCKGFD